MRKRKNPPRDAAKIIRRHYHLKRPVTDKEVKDEIANLKRKAASGTLDDSQELLYAALDLREPVDEERFKDARAVGILRYDDPRRLKGNPPRKTKGPRRLTVPEQHQLRIARDTLKMNDAMARVMGGPSKPEAREIIKQLTGTAPREENPHRRSAKTKAIASSYLRDVYTFFRKPSHGGLEKPAETAKHAKELADADLWAYDQGVDLKYYYGRDADEESESEWDGRVVAVHPDGAEADAYGYLGDDANQRHVEAEAKLALMQQMGGKRKRLRGRTKNPRRVSPTPGEARKIKAMLGRKKLVLRVRRGPRTLQGKKARGNPPIMVLGNPPADSKYLGKVTYIEYTHGHDGQPYYHHFKPPVFAQVTADGRVTLWHPTNNLWKLFPVPV